MSWQEDVDELNRRKEMAHEMGGKDSIAFHHGRGKLTVRERIEKLQDPGSFREIGVLAGSPTYDGEKLTALLPANSVVGTVKLDGRKVVVNGGDFTIRGGSADANVGNKGRVAEEMALRYHIPYIRLLDATGGSVKTFEKIGHTYLPQNVAGDLATQLLQEVPVVSAVMGSVAGLPAVQACQCHFNLMIKATSQVFVAGPPVVKAAHGVDIAKEELGNEQIQLRSGTINNLAESEEHAFELIRRFLSYLPSSVHEMPPRFETDDDSDRREEGLLSIIPKNKRQIYDPRKLLQLVLDRGSIFEISPMYGRSRITALARVNGYPVGVMINNPKFLGGSMDGTAGDKVIRFVEMCEMFHLPIVYFADEPGFMVGLAAEKQGIVRAGARVVSVISSSNIPMICFVIRQLFGVAGGLHHRSAGAYRRYAWPSGNWGSMHIEGGTTAAYRRVIADSDDPEAKRQQIETNLNNLASPFRTAHTFGIEDIIDPRDTRTLLVEFIDDVQPILKTQLGVKAGLGYRP